MCRGFFNSKFQFETGIRAKKIKLLENNHLETIRNAGYQMVGIAPNLSSLKPLTDFFQNRQNVDFKGCLMYLDL